MLEYLEAVTLRQTTEFLFSELISNLIILKIILVGFTTIGFKLMNLSQVCMRSTQ
jgi:hypothetical protein